MRTFALLLGLALLAGSCGRLSEQTATESAPGLVSSSMVTPDGRERTYHVFAPSTIADEPMPLLIAMHGGLGSGLQFRDNSGFDELAETNGFIVAYPDGIRILERRDNRVWNGGACCGVAGEGRQNVDDVGFIAAVIEEISAAYPVDPARVFATGHSNGAIMSYRLACELADTIVAIAFQSGSIEVDECAPSRPVSVLHLHGLADTNINLDGGPGDGVSSHDFASPLESIEAMATLNGCSGREAFADPTNPDVSGTRWGDCDSGTEVELMLVEGANHAWMGHPGRFVQEQLMGEPYADLDASFVIWEFLASHARD